MPIPFWGPVSRKPARRYRAGRRGLQGVMRFVKLYWGCICDMDVATLRAKRLSFVRPDGIAALRLGVRGGNDPSDSRRGTLQSEAFGSCIGNSHAASQQL